MDIAETFQIRWEGGLMATCATAAEAFALLDTWEEGPDCTVHRVQNGRFRTVERSAA